MDGDLVKLCPQCGSEFQMKVESCLDCGATLVVGVEGQGAAVPQGGAVEEAPAIPAGIVHLRTAATGWIARLSEDLDENGIRHWTTPPVWRRDPSLYVMPEDLEAASAIDLERYQIEVPDFAPEQPRTQRPAPRPESSSYAEDVKVCPSCGGEYQLWAETCADCGVPLVRPWDLDSARESAPRVAVPVASIPPELADPGACPACGERLPEGVDECPGCGLTLAQPEACPNCGAELNPHASGCRLCGFELFGSVEGS